MHWQDHLERFVTALGVTIAAGVYVFLFGTAILYTAFPYTSFLWERGVVLVSSPSIDVNFDGMFGMHQPQGNLRRQMRDNNNMGVSSSTRSSVNTLLKNQQDLQSAVDLWLDNRRKALARYGPITHWNVSLVENMAHLFEDAMEFNEDLSLWDTSNVKNMSSMFRGTKRFPGHSLSNWDVSRVRDFSHMFQDSNFNADLSQWTLGENVDTMESMFEDAPVAQFNLSNWIIPKAADTTNLFRGASSFASIHSGKPASDSYVLLFPASLETVLPPVGAKHNENDFSNVWRAGNLHESNYGVEDDDGMFAWDSAPKSRLYISETDMTAALYFGCLPYGMIVLAILATIYYRSHR